MLFSSICSPLDGAFSAIYIEIITYYSETTETKKDVSG
jgi:hypothetical protein